MIIFSISVLRSKDTFIVSLEIKKQAIADRLMLNNRLKKVG
jgi:hypothetical protein